MKKYKNKRKSSFDTIIAGLQEVNSQMHTEPSPQQQKQNYKPIDVRLNQTNDQQKNLIKPLVDKVIAQRVTRPVLFEMSAPEQFQGRLNSITKVSLAKLTMNSIYNDPYGMIKPFDQMIRTFLIEIGSLYYQWRQVNSIYKPIPQSNSSKQKFFWTFDLPNFTVKMGKCFEKSTFYRNYMDNDNTPSKKNYLARAVFSCFNIINLLPPKRIFGFIYSVFTKTKGEILLCPLTILFYFVFLRPQLQASIKNIGSGQTSTASILHTGGRQYMIGDYTKLYGYANLPVRYNIQGPPVGKQKQALVEALQQPKLKINKEKVTTLLKKLEEKNAQVDQAKSVMIDNGKNLSYSTFTDLEGINYPFQFTKYRAKQQKNIINQMQQQRMSQSSVTAWSQQWRKKNLETEQTTQASYRLAESVVTQIDVLKQQVASVCSQAFNDPIPFPQIPPGQFQAMITTLGNYYSTLNQWNFYIVHDQLIDFPTDIYQRIINLQMFAYWQRQAILTRLQTVMINIYNAYQGFITISLDQSRLYYFHELSAIYTQMNILMSIPSVQISQLLEQGKKYTRSQQMAKQQMSRVVSYFEKNVQQGNRSMASFNKQLDKSKLTILGGLDNFEAMLKQLWGRFSSLRQQQNNQMLDILKKSDFINVFSDLKKMLNETFQAVFNNQAVIMTGINSTFYSLQNLHNKVNYIYQLNFQNQQWTYQLSNQWGQLMQKMGKQLAQQYMKREGSMIQQRQKNTKRLQQTNAKVQSNIRSIQDKMASLDNSVQSFRNKLQTQTLPSINLEQLSKQYQKPITDFFDKLNAQLTNASTGSIQTITANKKKIDDSAKNIQSQVQKLKTTENTLKSTNISLGTIPSELAGVSKSLFEKINEIKSKQSEAVKSMQSRANGVYTKFDQLSNGLNQKIGTLTNTSNNIQTISKSMTDKLNSMRDGTGTNIDTITKQISEKLGSMRGVSEKSIQQVSKFVNDRLSKINQGTETNINNVTKQIADKLGSMRGVSQRSIQQISKNISERLGGIKSINDQNVDGLVRQLNTKTQQMTRQIRELRVNPQSLQNIKQLNTNLQPMLKLVNIYQKSMNILPEKPDVNIIQGLKQLSNFILQLKSGIQNQMSVFSNNNTTIQKKTQQNKQTLELLQRQILYTKQKQDDCEKKLAELNSIIRQLQKRLELSNYKNSQLEKQIQMCQQEKKKKQEQMKQYEDKIAQLQIRIKVLQSQLQKSNSENLQLRTELDQKNKQLMKSKQHVQQLAYGVQKFAQLFIQVHNSEVNFYNKLYQDVMANSQIPLPVLQHVKGQISKQYKQKMNNMTKLAKFMTKSQAPQMLQAYQSAFSDAMKGKRIADKQLDEGVLNWVYRGKIVKTV